jgi:hypothetical protein
MSSASGARVLASRRARATRFEESRHLAAAHHAARTAGTTLTIREKSEGEMRVEVSFEVQLQFRSCIVIIGTAVASFKRLVRFRSISLKSAG